MIYTYKCADCKRHIKASDEYYIGEDGQEFWKSWKREIEDFLNDHICDENNEPNRTILRS